MSIGQDMPKESFMQGIGLDDGQDVAIDHPWKSYPTYLTELNDSRRMPFPEIADIIEAQL